jgi:energy-coupling factor transporter ATP-binding protein EcfA2
MPEYSLDNVTIDGFRGLRKLRLEGLGHFNILVGENNSGKTSVLEALSILYSAFEPFEWVSMVRRRDFGRLDETRIQSLRWCFTQSGQLADPETMFEGECTMSCEGIPIPTLQPLQLRVTYKDIVGDPDPFEKDRRDRGLIPEGEEEGEEEIGDLQTRRGAEITHYVNNNLPHTAQIWEDQPVLVGRPRSRRILRPNETITPYSYQINRIQVRYQSQSVFDAGGNLVLDLMRELDPNVDDIKIASFRGARPAIYLQHRFMGPAPLSVFGDGLRRAVLLASVLPTLKGGGVLFIDEIDTGIHISAFKRVFAWLIKAARDLEVQIIATTHSLEAVDAIALAAEDRIDDLVTFHLEQTDQETHAKRIYGDLLLRMRRERGLDVR